MKKFLAFVVSLTMLFALVACGNKDNKEEAKQTAAAEAQAKDAASTEAPAADANVTDAAAEAPAADANVDMANKDKPLVWWNRQPSNSQTGELDQSALTFNDKTYYVGFDKDQGGEVQGQMVVDFIQKNADKIDRNGDGIIGYVLAIGDIGHNDSIARTVGVRKALGTAIEENGTIKSDPVGTNTDGTSAIVQDGNLTAGDKSFQVRELASQEMKSSAGATWDAATAGNAIDTWVSSFGDNIDVVVSNNDGMAMAMFNKWSKDNKIPTFGYDANSDAVDAIAQGFSGTINQHADVQAYLTLRVLRNALDGVDIDTGIGTADEAGNVLSDKEFKYVADQRSYYALNFAITADNFEEYKDATKTFAAVSNQLDASKHPSKKVWLSIYNSADNFLGSTYVPLLEKYDDLLNLEVEYVAGDGQTEANLTNRLADPNAYDAYAINLVKTDNGASYTALLN